MAKIGKHELSGHHFGITFCVVLVQKTLMTLGNESCPLLNAGFFSTEQEHCGNPPHKTLPTQRQDKQLQGVALASVLENAAWIRR